LERTWRCEKWWFGVCNPGYLLALRKGVHVIILGIILLIIGFIAHLAVLWTIGIIVLVVGVILAVAGAAGRQIGGRRHYY
ncbi:MAG: hypothetical protein ACRDPG_02570, partial [Nocardioidaceae bacterium]